jgi:AraC-like DNA-binding protein
VSRLAPALPGTDVREVPPLAGDQLDHAIHGEREYVSAATSWLPHVHPFHELIWAERGVLIIEDAARVWALSPGSALWIPAGHRHSGRIPSHAEYRAAFLPPATVSPLGDRPVSVRATVLLRELLLRLEDDLPAQQRSRIEAVIVDQLEPAEDAPELTLPADPRVLAIAHSITADPGGDHTLSAWAARVGLSTRTVTDLFRQSTGLSFREWLTHARVQRATALLEDRTPVQEVAEMVGFRSASAFGSAYRRVTGSSPGRRRP